MTVLKVDSESTTENANSKVDGFELESLVNGDNLSREDFMRIWEQLPNVKRAELINGVVYMPSPLGLDHGRMDHRLAFWLSTYELDTPSCQSASNVTWLMKESVPQPDSFLRLLPEKGGQSHMEGNYPAGAPELAVEIVSSSAAYDLHQKLRLYCEAGVQEYLAVVLRKPEIRWHWRVDNQYQMIEADKEGIFRSLVFPGLWLNGPALLRDDLNAVRATLQEGLRSKEHAEFVSKVQSKRG